MNTSSFLVRTWNLKRHFSNDFAFVSYVDKARDDRMWTRARISFRTVCFPNNDSLSLPSSHSFSLSLSFYESFFSLGSFLSVGCSSDRFSPPFPPLNSFFFVVFFVSSEEKSWQLIYAGASWITKLKFSPWPCLVTREYGVFLASWILTFWDDRVEKSINVSWPFEKGRTQRIFELIPFRIDLSIAA